MEIEIKAKVKNIAQLRKQIKAIGATHDTTVHQIDTYYSLYKRPWNKKSGRVVRVRDNGSQKSGRFEFHISQGPVAGIEYEVKVDSVKVLKQILEQMQAKPEVIVDKVREYYDKGRFQIVIDRVKGLGMFCEVELQGANTRANRLKVERMLSRIGITPDQYVLGHRYIDMALAKKGKKYAYF